jgi:hypothetical protein
MPRTPISSSVQADVLVESRRRCCICFGLNRDTSLKVGQIAHLDGNAVNSRKDNLAFLCFEHQDHLGSMSASAARMREPPNPLQGLPVPSSTGLGGR